MAGNKLPWNLNTAGLAPGSTKNISENKLKAFNIGSMNIKKGVTQKEKDDARKKKEQEEAAEVFKEFVESFDNSQKSLTQAWVKGGVVNPQKGEEEGDKSGPKLYKPTSKLLEKKLASSVPKPAKKKEEERPERPNKPMPTRQQLWTPTPMDIAPTKKKAMSAADKRKTNLELFKEELKVIQEERQERRKIKGDLGLVDEPGRKSSRFEPLEPVASGISLGLKSAMLS